MGKMIQKSSLKTQAYEYIKKGILSGEFKKDTIYSAQFFADVLGISRTPVREAVLQLAREHHVDILSNRGIAIRSLDAAQITEAVQMRVALEGFCASYLAEHIHTPEGRETLQYLKAICRKQEDVFHTCASRGISCDLEWFDQDTMFHMAINDFPGNKRIAENLAEIRAIFKNAAMVSAGLKGRKRECISEYHMIIEAIEKGSEYAAYQAMKCHVMNIRQKLLDVVASEPAGPNGESSDL